MALIDADLFLVNQGGVSKKLTYEKLKENIAADAGGGGGDTLWELDSNDLKPIDNNNNIVVENGEVIVGQSTSLPGPNAQFARLQVIGNDSNPTDRGAIVCFGHSGNITGLGRHTLLGQIIYTDNNSAECAFQSGIVGGPGTTSSSHPGSLLWATTPVGSTVPVKRMLLDEDGNLLLGGTLGQIVNNDPKTSINADGTAHFGGDVTSDGTIGFNLETDNPSAYRTEVVYGEEVQIYEGPVLDVKERILNLVSRLDALEANEIIDDAVDTSLLSLLASASARIDSIEARLSALEGGSN